MPFFAFSGGDCTEKCTSGREEAHEAISAGPRNWRAACGNALILPRLLKLVNMIPWKWRYSLTTVCAALMIFDAGMTLLSLDCWYQRVAGDPIQNAVEQFMADHYDNEFMQNHFQSMSIDPSNSTRTS